MSTTAPHPHPVYVIGIDGGGTGTRARLTSAGGRVLGYGEAGPSALSHGVPAAWVQVQLAMSRACTAAGLPELQSADCALGLGLSGANVRAQAESFTQAAQAYASLVLDSDAYTALLGAHGGKPGVIVAAGTGSIGEALHADGRRIEVGGWGFPAGDEGSGAWLGLRAMRHAQQAADGEELHALSRGSCGWARRARRASRRSRTSLRSSTSAKRASASWRPTKVLDSSPR